MAKEKIAGDTCPICHQPIDVSVRMAEPFLFVKKVDQICFVCYSVPNMWYIEDGQSKRHESFSEKTVHTVEEMAEDGFDKKEAKTSIKAVISFWKKYRKEKV
jgi:hypothetical protein